MIPRTITEKLESYLKQFPIVSLTGPRQSGKSTLLKTALPDYAYANLEQPDVLLRAKDDPIGFLENLGSKAIIDEAQRFPDLFSYLQVKSDEINQPGMFVLSGSQNFLMMEHITQSLAGRVGILKLLPLSYRELSSQNHPLSTNEWLYQGGYPRIYDWGVNATDYYTNYVSTYLERDIRQLINIGDALSFRRFIGICAGRIGQILNVSDLADAADISRKTAQSWLSALEASYLVFFAEPYYRNIGKRLVKSPKLYFFDTGLACCALGIRSKEQLETYYQRGSLFENMVMSEYMKYEYNHGNNATAYFWRDNHKNEIDLLAEPNLKASAFEIKASATARPNQFATIDRIASQLDIPEDHRFVVYDGAERIESRHGTYLPWSMLYDALA